MAVGVPRQRARPRASRWFGRATRERGRSGLWRAVTRRALGKDPFRPSIALINAHVAERTRVVSRAPQPSPPSSRSPPQLGLGPPRQRRPPPRGRYGRLRLRAARTLADRP